MILKINSFGRFKIGMVAEKSERRLVIFEGGGIAALNIVLGCPSFESGGAHGVLP
jgi:hypothetical protein